MKLLLKTSCVVLTFVVIAVSAAQGQKAAAKRQRIMNEVPEWLTGVWQGNDGGTYQVRHQGTKLWWFGRSPSNGRDWQNVFCGSISGDQVTGDWADLPGGGAQSSGTLQLQIQPGRITKLNDTGGFGGVEWSPGSNGISSGASVGDIGAVLPGIDTNSKLPGNYQVAEKSSGGRGKMDAATGLPVPRDVIAWFDLSAPMLQDILRRLAGDEAVQQYLDWEQRQHPNELQRVDLRLKAISKLIH